MRKTQEQEPNINEISDGNRRKQIYTKNVKTSRPGKEFVIN